MDESLNRNELANLRSAIDRAAQLYYSLGSTSELSDQEYDGLLVKLRQLCPNDERLTRVGVPYPAENGFQKIPHTMPMGSIDNIEGGISGLNKWVQSISEKLGVNPEFVVSHKMDGISASAQYENGKLVRVLTRGNGKIGDDITSNAVRWIGLPTIINTTANITVRGEAILYQEEFDRLNVNNVYENPRNLCSGIAGRLDGTDNEKIRFIAFNMHGSKLQLSDKLKVLTHLGFKTVTHAVTDNIEAIEYTFNQLESEDHGGCGQRKSLDYQIDGIVICVNNQDYQEQLNVNPNDELRPKYARAIKFASYTANSRVVDCEITIGHSGVLIPTIKVEPVRIGGVTVSSVLLNNWNASSVFPSAAHVAIGDVIEIGLSGDIIPKCTKIIDKMLKVTHGTDASMMLFNELIDKYELNSFGIKSDDLKLEQQIELGNVAITIERQTIPEPKEWNGRPTTRMRRGTLTAMTYVQLEDDDDLVIKAKIKHFIGSSRKGIGILGIGDSVLDALVEQSRLVRKPGDLYRLTLEDIENLPIGTNAAGGPIRLGSSRANSILREIAKNKKLTLPKLLGSIGIDLLGERKVEQLMVDNDLVTLDDWRDESKLSKINGEIVRQTIIDGLNANWCVIEDLLSAGVEIIESEVKMNQKMNVPNNPFKGLNVCFTGTRECLEDVEKLGATIKSGVSKNVDLLVQQSAMSTSNKTTKAEELGIKIIGIDALKEILAGKRDLVL